jgi:hypothetical protein
MLLITWHLKSNPIFCRHYVTCAQIQTLSVIWTDAIFFFDYVQLKSLTLFAAIYCENYLFGGAFALVRHAPQGSVWHNATFVYLLDGYALDFFVLA